MYLLLLINATRKKIKHAQPTSLLYDTMAMWRRAPLVRNRAETHQGLGGSLQKGYQQVAGVSTRCFNEAATKKHEPSLQKLTFCLRARWADAHRIVVNKIKVF
jgi:hypothetical protein